jgi:hypothetical protein
MAQLEFNSELDIPLGLLLGARFTGYDELGNPVYRGSDGRSYAVPGGTPTNPTAGMGVAKDTGKKRGSVVKGLARDPIEGIKSIAKAIYGGTVDAVAMPGRAAAGEIVTMGDILNTAGMVQLGGAAMPAPKGALRSGAVREAATAAQSKADEVLQLLKSGRGADVTDEMLAAADPQALWAGYDLPMDAASRMDRARGMGFDTETPLYHGTAADFQAFRSEGMNDRARRWNFVSENPDFASQYATANAAKHGKDGVSTLPLRANLGVTLDAGDAKSVADLFAKNTGADAAVVGGIRRGIDEKWPNAKFSDLVPSPPEYPSDAYTKWANLRDKINDIESGGLGQPGSDYWDTIEKSTVPERWGADSFVTRERKLAERSAGAMEDARNYGIQNPANIRSQFARFDPRLAHLSNLNASNASPSVGAMTMAQILGEEEATRRPLASFFPR